MSNSSPTQAGSLQGLLMPLASGYLLLPSAATVEVLRYPKLEQADADKADWYLGNLQWRRSSLPVISWEKLTGQSTIETDNAETGTNQRKRIVVCHLFLSSAEAAFVGIEVHGLPQLITVDEADIQTAKEVPNIKLIIGELTLKDFSAQIPDLERLAKKLVSLVK